MISHVNFPRLLFNYMHYSRSSIATLALLCMQKNAVPVIVIFNVMYDVGHFITRAVTD